MNIEMSLETLQQLIIYRSQCRTVRIAKEMYDDATEEEKGKFLIDIKNHESDRDFTATLLADKLLADLNKKYNEPLVKAITLEKIL